MAKLLKAAATKFLPFNAMARQKFSTSGFLSQPPSNAVSEAVFTNPTALGLVIIISNDYNHTQLRSLTGTHMDSEAMQKTFKKLKYAIVCRHNVTKSQLMEVFSEASLGISYPETYKRIVVVFSGHGTHDNCLYTQDCQRVRLDNIISMFLPRQSQHLAGIPKLFFIDACRGDKIDPGCTVPRGADSTRSRGGKILPSLRLPCEGNYLLAYSTMYGYQAYEMKGKGGIWLSLLSQNLAFMDKSVLDVLTDINKELIEGYQEYWKDYIQQPELHSSLNEPVYFLREAMEYSCVDTQNGDFESSVVCLTDPGEPNWVQVMIPTHSTTDNPSDDYYTSSEDCLSSEYSTPSSSAHETLSRAVLPVHTVTSISRASSTSSSSNRPLRSQFVSRCVPSDSARSQLEEYCCIHDKPPPSYQSVYCSERGRYIVKVYVAKTVGWVEGLQMSKKELAKESAANELLKKLNFYGNEN